MFKTYPIDLFYPGLDESPYYRIPVLLKLSDNTLIAGSDQRRMTEFDWGKINPVLRFKKINKEEFSQLIKVIDLNGEGTCNPPFNIDMCLLEKTKGENKGRIYMLIDAYRSSGNYRASKKDSGYINIQDKKYLKLFDEKQNLFYIDELGNVHHDDGTLTDLYVKIKDVQPFNKLGNIYKNNELVGNIYKDNSKYQIYQTSYIWMTYSDDGGNNRLSPIDITNQIEDSNMKFVGMGPGRGIELSTGRLVFPIYYSVDDKNRDNKENTAVIYTDDGMDFKRSKSVNDIDDYNSLLGEYPISTSESQLIEMDNKDVWIFYRNTSGKVRYSISKDSCETWSKQYEVDFKSLSTCMLSVVKFNKDNKEYILLSNPMGPERTKGSIKLLEVTGDKVKTIAEKSINDVAFTYSALEKISDKQDFALLYEELREVNGEERQHLKYIEFDLEWVLSDKL